MGRWTILLLLGLTSAVAAGCGGRVRLEMGGLDAQSVPTMAENAAAMRCDLRRGIGRVSLRCPGVAYPDKMVDMVIYPGGRVECIAQRDYEDDCPLIAEALLSHR